MDKQDNTRKWWQLGWLRAHPVLETTLLTPVPIDIAIEKLKGFVSDHQAKVVATHENSVELELSSDKVSSDRRKSNRHVTFRLELEFCEERENRTNNVGLAAGEHVQTRIDVKIRPKRGNKRRMADTAERARQTLQSIKAYLMARESAELKRAVAAAAE